MRFNSWDFVTQPDALLTRGIEEILGKQPLVIIAITFAVLVSLHWLMKRVTLGFFGQGNGGVTFKSNRINTNTHNAG